MRPAADIHLPRPHAAEAGSKERLPSLSTLAAGLRKTTETLARELASPTHQAPCWNDLEWRLAQAAAAIHGVSSLLSTRLRWRGPQAWQRFLDEQRLATLERQRRLFKLIQQLDARSKQAGLALMPLKGVALHELGLYEPGERPMADLDLLVQPERAQAAAEVLAEFGYVETQNMWKHRILEPIANRHVHGSLGEHANNPLKIDLHTCIKERLPLSEVDITDSFLPACALPGMNAYSSAAALMRHLLLHAAGNMQNRGLRLIQLHDIALLAERMSDEDWCALLEAGTPPWWALPPLQLMARDYPQAVPEFVFAALRKHCPWWLRVATDRKTVTDFSLSSLPVTAFPGISWSRSPIECMRYMQRRLRPSRADLGTRKYLAAQPWGLESPWPHLSQWRRILRWIVHRPPRVETLYVIRLALEREGR